MLHAALQELFKDFFPIMILVLTKRPDQRCAPMPLTRLSARSSSSSAEQAASPVADARELRARHSRTRHVRRPRCASRVSPRPPSAASTAWLCQSAELQSVPASEGTHTLLLN